MSDARRYAVWPEPSQGHGHSREVDRQSPTGLIFYADAAVSEMTYTVSSGTLNPSILYHTIPYYADAVSLL